MTWVRAGVQARKSRCGYTLYFSLAVGFQLGSRLLGVIEISVPSGAAKFKLPPSTIVRASATTYVNHLVQGSWYTVAER